MKVLLSISLSLLILVCATSRAWVYLAFKLNQSYIAAELCENRLEPLILCSGVCYLDKQLELLDEKEQNSNAVQKLEVKDFHFPSILGEEEDLGILKTDRRPISSVNRPTSVYAFGLLKPPQASRLI